MPYRLITQKSPFNDNILQYKQYQNFSYALYDMSNNEFDKNKTVLNDGVESPWALGP